jgi:hypothetical protein
MLVLVLEVYILMDLAIGVLCFVFCVLNIYYSNVS